MKMNQVKFVAIAMVFAVWGVASAATMKVPAAYQAAIFKKVCQQYIPAHQNGKISIIVPVGELENADLLARQFRLVQYEVEIIQEDQLSEASGQIFYLTTGLSADTLSQVSQSKKFTLTESPSYVGSGYASFGIVANGQRVGLLTNLHQLQNSGTNVDLSLLTIAHITDKKN